MHRAGLTIAVAAAMLACSCQSSTSHTPALRPTAVQLTAVPVGTASLTVSKGDITARFDVSGFTIRSTHGVVLRSGSCASPKAQIVSFPDLEVDAYGAAKTTLRSKTKQPVPSSANLVIMLAPTVPRASNASATPLACVDVPATNHAAAMPLIGSRGTAPSATVTLTYTSSRTLAVHVTAHGLAPNSAHAVHVHFGSCQQQSGVLYTVGNVTADANGRVDTTITLTGISAPPARGWYVDLHDAPIAGLLRAGQPTLGFQPVLCGDGHF